MCGHEGVVSVGERSGSVAAIVDDDQRVGTSEIEVLGVQQ